MTGGLSSSGRGGAGNMVDAEHSLKIHPKDLETPTLKTSVVTTGRGGTGNMAPNKDAAETRMRQDVEAYVFSLFSLSALFSLFLSPSPSILYRPASCFSLAT